MSQRNTLVRSMHDLGLAAWFGGSLMGTVGLNGGAATAKSPAERLAISSRGWAKWAPVQLAAIAVHGIGGLGLIAGNKTRLVGQQEARTNTVIKIVITGLAGASTLASGLVGTKMGEHAAEGGEGVTEPGAGSSTELSSAQRMQKVLQWTTPLLTSVLIVLAAQQGEQQRPIKGLWETTLKNLRR
ncbi:hypothetical protein GCM10027413_06100 [Conyzicola nivalis]|uniref:Uncharacterized protein n=1 Tax=Conyzicola nivalis TaxID=1477021 RepID=A0A916SNW0_9MICO|nr:hypothetical protein [Conyzicola nivalis]GGB05734.1 hypothetical protein GCM10010979_20530 [Conyzicola nivalis]